MDGIWSVAEWEAYFDLSRSVDLGNHHWLRPYRWDRPDPPPPGLVDGFTLWHPAPDGSMCGCTLAIRPLGPGDQRHVWQVGSSEAWTLSPSRGLPLRLPRLRAAG